MRPLPPISPRFLGAAGALLLALGLGAYAWLLFAPAGHGFVLRRFEGARFEGAASAPRVVAEPFERHGKAAAPFSAEWLAFIPVEQQGPYQVAVRSVGKVEVLVDGTSRLSTSGVHDGALVAGRFDLPAGVHELKVRLSSEDGAKYLRLYWLRMIGPNGIELRSFDRQLAWPTAEAAKAALGTPNTTRASVFALTLLLGGLGIWLLVRSRAVARGRPVLDRKGLVAAAIVLVVALGARWRPADEIDVHFDEFAYFVGALNYVRNVQLADTSPGAFAWHEEHPPCSKWIFGFGAAADGMAGAKRISSLMQALTCLVLFLLGRRFVSTHVGFGAAIALALMPFYLSQGWIVGLESAVALLFALSAYFLLVACTEQSGWHHALWGFTSVLGLGVRSTGVWFALVALVLCVAAFVKGPRRLPPYLWSFLGAAVALLVIFAVWPSVWRDPLAHAASAFKREYEPDEYFLGALRKPPVWYHVFAFLAVNPVGLVVLVLPWAITSLWRRSLPDLLVACWLVLPFSQCFIAFRQDSARYVFPAFPALAFAAAWGTSICGAWIAQRTRPVVWTPYLPQAVLAAYVAFSSASVHPYEIDYFSEWTGGPGEVARKKWMEVPWWGEGEFAAAREVNRLARPGAKVWIKGLPAFPELRPDLKPAGEDADYMATSFFQFPPEPKGWALVRTIRAGGSDGAPLVGIYEKVRAEAEPPAPAAR